jgi:hypothetical protein
VRRVRMIQLLALGLAVGALVTFGVYKLLNLISDGPTTVPACAWPLRVVGKTTTTQEGLIKCYLRDLALRSKSELAAVAAQPVIITAKDFEFSADARSGLATASFEPNAIASGTVDVSIRFADGKTSSLEMFLVNPASWRSWRLLIGTPTGPRGPHPAEPRS